MSWWRRLAAVLLVVGVILSQLRATAATIPMLVASVAMMPPPVTTHAETQVPLRQRTEEARTTVHDAALTQYGSASNLPLTAAPLAVVRESYEYDDGLKLANQRDHQGEGAIYAAASAVPAAEGAAVGAPEEASLVARFNPARTLASMRRERFDER